MKQKMNNVLTGISNHLSACMAPLIPVIIAGSMMKLICLILNMAGILSGTTGTLLETIGDAPFYFLPVLAAVTAADHFKADRFYTIGTACMFMMPGFIELLEGTEEITFLMFPVIRANYAYNILPVILMAWLIGKFEPKAAKVFPQALKATIYPLVVFTITTVCGFLVVGPIGAVISSGLSNILNFLSEHAGILAWPLYAALMPILIPMGMHWIFVTMSITQITMNGFDNGLEAGFLIVTMTLVGADLAVSLRTKDSELRGQAISAAVVAAFTGVTEPSLFGVCLKEKRALKGVMVSGALAGIFLGITKIKCYVYSFPAVTSILMFRAPDGMGNLINAVILCVLSAVLGFVLTLIFMGKKETN